MTRNLIRAYALLIGTAVFVCGLFVFVASASASYMPELSANFQIETCGAYPAPADDGNGYLKNNNSYAQCQLSTSTRAYADVTQKLYSDGYKWWVFSESTWGQGSDILLLRNDVNDDEIFTRRYATTSLDTGHIVFGDASGLDREVYKGLPDNSAFDFDNWRLESANSGNFNSRGTYIIAYTNENLYYIDSRSELYAYLDNVTLGTSTSTSPNIYNPNGTTRFTTLTFSGTSTVEINAGYYLDPDEYNRNVSAYNPTYIKYWYAYGTSTEFERINEPMATTTGAHNVSTFIDGLIDGNYEVLIGFTNFGCMVGLSDCPFPEEYIYTSFEIAGGILVGTGTQEFYSRQDETGYEREPCTITNISGCFINFVNDLFRPSEGVIPDFVDTIRTDFLTRVPVGYLTRFYDILNSSSTVALPTFVIPIPVGAGSEVFTYETVTFDMADMITGGGTLIDSIRDPIYNKSPRDIFEPLVQQLIALLLVVAIVADVMKMQHADDKGSSRKGKLS